MVVDLTLKRDCISSVIQPAYNRAVPRSRSVQDCFVLDDHTRTCTTPGKRSLFISFASLANGAIALGLRLVPVSHLLFYTGLEPALLLSSSVPSGLLTHLITQQDCEVRLIGSRVVCLGGVEPLLIPLRARRG